MDIHSHNICSMIYSLTSGILVVSNVVVTLHPNITHQCVQLELLSHIACGTHFEICLTTSRLTTSVVDFEILKTCAQVQVVNNDRSITGMQLASIYNVEDGYSIQPMHIIKQVTVIAQQLLSHRTLLLLLHVQLHCGC